MIESNGMFELDGNDFVIIAGKNSNEYAIVMCDRLAFNGLKVVRVSAKTLFEWLETQSQEHSIDIFVKTASTENEIVLFAPKAPAGASFSERMTDDEKYKLEIKIAHARFKEREDDVFGNKKPKEEQSKEIEIDR